VETSILYLQEKEDREGGLVDVDLASLYNYLAMHNAFLSP